ncbi:hypothetical protein REPUB_Repub17cG0176200 [Reevesia pubescens]
MSLTRALDLFDPSPTLFYFLYEEPELSFPFDDVFEPSPTFFSSFLSPFGQAFDVVTGVTRLLETPLLSHYRRIRTKDEMELCSGALLDGISGLELGAADPFNEWDRKYTWNAEIKSSDKSEAGRKYHYTAEIKGFEGRKYEWTAEIESPERNGTEKKYKWTAEIKGRKEGNVAKKHDTCKVEIQGTQKKKEEPLKIKELGSHAGACIGFKEKTKGECSSRVVDIVEPADHAAILLRQAFGRRAGEVARLRGKRKVLSPDEAALVIERTFRAYLIRRSKALRSLRELAVAKAKLKELRALFNNYSYRQSIARDSEEHQRFSERIISLILTVDASQVVSFCFCLAIHV